MVGIRESGKIPPAMQFETHVATQEIYEAAKLAAESEYGLSLGILTRDVVRGLDLAGRIPTGFGEAANLEAFTDTRWVTIRGDIAPYPF